MLATIAVLVVALVVLAGTTATTNIQFTVKETNEGAGITASSSFDEVADGGIVLSPSIPASTNDVEVDIVFDTADLGAILITTDQDLTLETNSSSAADDTFALKAGRPFFWAKNTGIPNPFTANVTKFFFSNANASAASVKIRGVKDSTP